MSDYAGAYVMLALLAIAALALTLPTILADRRAGQKRERERRRGDEQAQTR
jgi:hypothetical protein